MKKSKEFIKKFNEAKQRFPKTVDYVGKNLVKKRRCNRCGSIVLKEPNVEEYPYQCMFCDENLFGIETHKGNKCNEQEYLELIEQSRILALDNDVETFDYHI